RGIQNRDLEFAEVVWAFFASRLPATDPIVSLPMRPVDSPGNPADTRTGFGAVGYRYAIGTFEVTAGQYAAFLNAVARADPYGLYDSNPGDMATWPTGPRIQRSGSPGAYTYAVAADYANRPINFISWGDAARFVNWLHNGQPIGAQGPATTERGAYTLDGATTDAALLAVTRSPGARFALPTEDEWYKAAYFDPAITAANKYWTFATRSNATPSNQLLTPDPGNSANFFQNNVYSLPGFLRTNVGDFENSPGPWGTFDQMGNVGEWTETLRGAVFAVRGESYSTGDSGGTQLGHRFVRAVAASEEETKSGFRVVSTLLSSEIDGLIFGSGFEAKSASSPTGVQRQDVTIPQQDGGSLQARLVAPLPATGPYPALSLLPGGGAPIDSVAWAADGLARAGYVVIVTQPASGGSLAAYDTAARSGIDFLLSSANPFAAATRGDRVGVAGWSLGARALSRTQDEDARVSALVAWDNLALNETGDAGSPNCSGSNPPSTRRPRVPALGQASDFCGPPAETVETKKTAYEGWRAAGQPVMQVVLAGSSHFVWGTQGSGTARQAQALYYTQAWFDRWLKDDTGAGARLLARSVDGVAVEQVLSTRFRSAAAFDGRNCPDLRTACGP
ncbi:MAG: SUMF1/EgtB/PvdO family nonheme iron enzyme, partial [Burkholderiaceae bacterium]